MRVNKAIERAQSDSDNADSLEITLEFDTPVTAEDLRERFEALAESMREVEDDGA